MILDMKQLELSYTARADLKFLSTLDNTGMFLIKFNMHHSKELELYQEIWKQKATERINKNAHSIYYL